MGMIERGAEEDAALETASELTCQLFHASDCSDLGHVFTQHFKIFEQHCAFVFQRRLERFAAINCIFYLTKDPWICHSTAANQNSIASRLSKTRQCLFDHRHIAASRNRHPHHVLDLPD